MLVRLHSDSACTHEQNRVTVSNCLNVIKECAQLINLRVDCPVTPVPGLQHIANIGNCPYGIIPVQYVTRIIKKCICMEGAFPFITTEFSSPSRQLAKCRRPATGTLAIRATTHHDFQNYNP